MFTVEERERLRDTLLSAAREDTRLAGAALTGSAAVSAEDREHGAVHHLDVVAGATVYRVFLLGSTLQVDIGFAPPGEFAAKGPSFRQLFGEPAMRRPRTPDGAARLMDMGRLLALHARSSIARGRIWQAEHMISGMRANVIALACLRHGVPDAQGRGADLLPPDVTVSFVDTLVRSVDVAEPARAFRAGTEALTVELGQADPELAARLSGPLRELRRI